MRAARRPYVEIRTGLRTPARRRTSRGVNPEALLGLDEASSEYASLDAGAWRAYEAAEEQWIRDRYELVLEFAPEAASAADLDLEVNLADLKLRRLQFRHLLARNCRLVRGGIREMTDRPMSPAEITHLAQAMPGYRRQEERVHRLLMALQHHPQFDLLQRARVRMWKTPRYREIHGRYLDRMQELQQLYSGGCEQQ